ncbi:MAG TPA: tetratricopeptide repeat protein [Acidimicrobiales bacterium]|nr:tetratricopeptide repeat protein [Acidimicrobiales bacterium]
MRRAPQLTARMTSLPAGPDLAELSDDELVEERDFLLRSLEDLEAERGAGDVDEGDYGVLKDGYTARAAAVLKELEARRDGTALVVEGFPSPAHPPWWRRGKVVAAGAGVAAFAVAAGVLVAHTAGDRLPGQSVSGSVPNSRVAQLLVQAGNDVQKNDIKGALKAYHDALQIDPSNAEALANQGWLVAILGNTANDRSLMDQGLAGVRKAEQVDPSLASAHFFAGSILLQEGDAKGAVTEFQAYLNVDPSSPQAALVRKDLETAQALAEGKLPAGAVPAPTTTSVP